MSAACCKVLSLSVGIGVILELAMIVYYQFDRLVSYCFYKSICKLGNEKARLELIRALTPPRRTTQYLRAKSSGIGGWDTLAKQRLCYLKPPTLISVVLVHCAIFVWYRPGTILGRRRHRRDQTIQSLSYHHFLAENDGHKPWLLSKRFR